MRQVLMMAAALFAVSVAAHAQMIDKNGRCHAKDGKFAKMEVCKGVASSPDSNGPYKLDAKGKCHDVHGKMSAKAKCAV
jgi:hypothetical protein